MAPDRTSEPPRQRRMIQHSYRTQAQKRQLPPALAAGARRDAKNEIP